MERGLVPVSPRYVRDLAELYGVNDSGQIKNLVSMTATTRQRDWWHKFDNLLPRQFSVYLGFEGDAASIHTFEALLVPGLLQTESYARALFQAGRPGEPAQEIERLVESRMLRQGLLASDDAPKLWAILDEAALRRRVGGVAVMREQLDHLLARAQQPNITIQVVPFKVGAYLSMEGGFIILRFPEPLSKRPRWESLTSS